MSCYAQTIKYPGGIDNVSLFFLQIFTSIDVLPLWAQGIYYSLGFIVLFIIILAAFVVAEDK